MSNYTNNVDNTMTPITSLNQIQNDDGLVFGFSVPPSQLFNIQPSQLFNTQPTNTQPINIQSMFGYNNANQQNISPLGPNEKKKLIRLF